MEALEKIRARGDNDFSASDFDSMPFLIAFGKVWIGPFTLDQS